MKQIVLHAGFLEGHRHFQRLQKKLQTAGFQMVTHKCYSQEAPSTHSALHISHSAGVLCEVLELTTLPKLIIAPPISKHRIRRVWATKIFEDLAWAMRYKEIKFWLYKSFWSFIALFDFRTWRFLARSMKTYEPNLDEVLEAARVRVIANADDPFTESLCDDKRCIVLDGHHDDLLYRPEFYITHIQEMVNV